MQRWIRWLAIIICIVTVIRLAMAYGLAPGPFSANSERAVDGPSNARYLGGLEQ